MATKSYKGVDKEIAKPNDRDLYGYVKIERSAQDQLVLHIQASGSLTEMIDEITHIDLGLDEGRFWSFKFVKHVELVWSGSVENYIEAIDLKPITEQQKILELLE